MKETTDIVNSFSDSNQWHFNLGLSQGGRLLRAIYRGIIEEFQISEKSWSSKKIRKILKIEKRLDKILEKF